MKNALGKALAVHRDACRDCTPHRACDRYVQIAAEHTAARQIRAGAVAPHVVLSVREDR